MLPKTIKLVEVAPRDGLQNEKKIIPTPVKLAFIKKLADAGFSQIEVTSFVSPKWVPAMADHHEIMQSLRTTQTPIYSVLTPNLKGLQKAIESGAKHIAVFTSSSETFSQKNTNCSIDKSLKNINELATLAKKNNVAIRAYISCTLGCPYEGLIPYERTKTIAEDLLALGIEEISLADTIGIGTPKQATDLIRAVTSNISIENIAVHFHDTYGQALANIYACLQLGVSTIDASAGGLGGCPYAKGATGNVATETVLYMLNGLGIKTGVKLEKVKEATAFIKKYL